MLTHLLQLGNSGQLVPGHWSDFDIPTGLLVTLLVPYSDW